MTEDNKISMKQLGLIRELQLLVNNSAIEGERENYSAKKLREYDNKIREIMEYFSDCACAHEFHDFGKLLMRCKHCKSTRLMEPL
jgi:hypothetical protein